MSKEYLLPPNSPTSKLQTKSKKNITDAHRRSTIFPRRTYPIESNDYIDNIQEREIRQLLDTVPIVPKLPKMPDISKYLNKGKTLNKSKALSDRRTIIKNYM
jgi:hypothetical protein